jgi:hypothetical protein
VTAPSEHPAPPPEPTSAPFVVAAIAGVAAAVWCLLVLPEVSVPLLVFAVPASALLWFWIALHLARRRALPDAGCSVRSASASFRRCRG